MALYPSSHLLAFNRNISEITCFSTWKRVCAVVGIVVSRGRLLQRRSYRTGGAKDPQSWQGQRVCAEGSSRTLSPGEAFTAPGKTLTFLQRVLAENMRKARDEHWLGCVL